MSVQSLVLILTGQVVGTLVPISNIQFIRTEESFVQSGENLVKNNNILEQYFQVLQRAFNGCDLFEKWLTK